jgi:hypothetical protein
MFLKVSAASTVTLEDAHNFRAFKVVVATADTELGTVRSALASVATLPDRGTAWVSEQALRAWPGYATDAAWQSSLTVMIEKARPHGWIDEASKSIKAHVEWVS